MAEFSEAIKAWPEFPDAMESMGSALRRLGQYKTAIGYYNKAIGMRPDFSRTICNKAECLYEIGEFAESLACIDRAVELDPGIPNWRAFRRKVLERLGTKTGGGK